MLDEMKEAGRSKQSGTLVKKKSSSGCLVKAADTVGGVSGFSDSSSRNLSRSSKKEKKRRRVVESDSESSDYASETTHKLDKRSAVYKEFETEKRASSGLDVFEFDEYDGFEDVRSSKDANGGKHRWKSYRQSVDQMESGNGGSRPTYEARSTSPLQMEDDDFDLPLSVLSKKYRSSSIRVQGKNGVMKVMVNKNDRKEAEDQQKKKLDKNDDHRDAGDGQSSKSKEKGRMKSVTPMVRKSNKKVNESDTVNSRVESVKKVKEKENMVKHGSGTEKQILREKIKNMLLDAGWSIDYRPRKNKNYLDAIYINPAGTAYWSIIKAYEVLQKEEEDNAEDIDNFTPLPVEILGKLARQTQNKTERELKRKRKDKDEGKRGMEDTDSDYEEELDSHGRRKSRCTLLVRDSNKVLENDGISPYSGKRTILTWLMDSGVVDMNEHVEYMNARRTRILQKGRITKDGIHCGCCSKILTVFKFEQHSGSKLCNPFPNIFLESGKSLMQCQFDAWNKVGELEQKSFYTVDVDGDDPNDDTCSVCGDGGDLICCDGCPSTFHQSCLDIEMLPEGDWLCPNCSCTYCEMAGGITEASLLTCCLCYKKYHESCRPRIDVKPHEPNSLDLSFCGHKCHEVYIPLQKLIGVKHELDSGFSWSLIHRSDSDSLTDAQRMECNSMLAVAMSLMDECFLPFTDRRSGINLIRNVVFNCGSNLSRLNYSGFHTAILEREEEVVCAASIRFHGTQLAEMPFIGTRHIYRRQGMCRRLLSAIESALSGLQVDKLIIPAVAEHMNTWTDVFGFQPLEESHKQEMKRMNMLVFPRTDMLQKPLIKQAIPQGKKSLEVDGVSGFSEKPELISANVTDLSDNNGFQESGAPMDDVSNGTNPLPDPSSEHKLQQSRKESDSHSNGNNPKQGSCGAVSDPEATNDLSNTSALGLDKTTITDASPLDATKETHPINSQHQLPGKEVHVHHPIQLSKNESFSSMDADAQTQGKNTIELDDVCKNTASIDSGSQECVVSLDMSNSPAKDESPCEPDSDSNVHGVDVQNGNQTNSKQGSCGSEINRKLKEKEKERTNDLSGVHSCNDHSVISTSSLEIDDDCRAFSIKEVISSNDKAITDSRSQECGLLFDDPDSGSHNNIVSSEIPEPGMESVSKSQVTQIAMQNDNETDPKGNNTIEVDDGSALSKKHVAEFSDNTTITNSGSEEVGVPFTSPIKYDDILVPVSACKSELVANSGNDAHFDSNSNVEGYTYTRVVAKITKDYAGEPKHQLPEKESNSIYSHSDSKVDEIDVHVPNGIIPCELHKPQQPGKESDSIHSHSNSIHGNPETEIVKDSSQFF